MLNTIPMCTNTHVHCYRHEAPLSRGCAPAQQNVDRTFSSISTWCICREICGVDWTKRGRTVCSPQQWYTLYYVCVCCPKKMKEVRCQSNDPLVYLKIVGYELRKISKQWRTQSANKIIRRWMMAGKCHTKGEGIFHITIVSYDWMCLCIRCMTSTVHVTLLLCIKQRGFTQETYE